MIHETEKDRFVDAFLAGRHARQCIRSARVVMGYATAAHHAGNLERFEDLKTSAKTDRDIFHAIRRWNHARPGFMEGFHDEGSEKPADAASAAFRRSAPDLAAIPGLRPVGDLTARREAVDADMRRRAWNPDPDNRP